MKLQRWIAEARRRSRRRRDDIAVEKVLLEHEEAERRSLDPRTPIPGMRGKPDFGDWAGPGGV